MAIEKIFVINADADVRGFVSQALEAHYDLTQYETVEAGLSGVVFAHPEAIFVTPSVQDFDRLFERNGGTELPPVIVLATNEQRAAAVNAVQRGAFAWQVFPCSTEELTSSLARAAVYNQFTGVCRYTAGSDANAFIGESFVTSQLRSTLSKVSHTDVPVLIRGNAGAGKELLARLVHNEGVRANRPFIKVDCAAVSATNFSSYLFGNSSSSTVGALELAAGGTLFIDEVSCMPRDIQDRLLTVMQQRKFQRADGSRSFPVDTRIIASSTRDLEAEVRRGALSETLFASLNIVPIWVPPLAERPQDIRLLANAFTQYFARKHGRDVQSISGEALTHLEYALWPCNVSQLRAAVEQAVLNCAGNVIGAEHFSSQAPTPSTNAVSPVIENLDEIEKSHILAVLSRCNGNRTTAAKRLGISIRTIRNKLKLYRTQANIEVLQEAA